MSYRFNNREALMFNSIFTLVLCLCLYFTQVAPSYAQASSLDYSNSSAGSMSLSGNPLEAPKCERPKKLSDILDKANEKYSGLLAPKQSQLATVNNKITQANNVVTQKKSQYEAALRNSTLSPTQVANFREQYETAVANVRTLEAQKSQLQTDISGISQAKSAELDNINAFKQYDTVEAYLDMAVSQEDKLMGGKGMEILAVADVGRRLQCQQAGDTMSQSYSIFKQASNAFSVNMSEDTQEYMSKAQLDMIEECKTISDAKEAQYQALQRLLKSKMRTLEAASDKMMTVQALADGYLPALEAARMEQQAKTDRQKEAEAWVKEAEGKVAAAEKKVAAAEKRVEEAEEALKQAKEELKRAQEEEKKADRKKMMALIVAAVAAAIYIACMSSAGATTGGGACVKFHAKKIAAALAVIAAILFLTAKKSEVAEAEGKVKEAEAELKAAKAELEAALAELDAAMAELEQAMAELEAANIHTHLTCSVTGGSELAQSETGADASSDGQDTLENQNATADSLISGFLSKHEGEQPAAFPEPQSRITYLEHVTGLSSSGVAELKKVERKIQQEIEEIQGIMTQMNNISVNTDIAGGYDTTTFCMDSQGNLDTQCRCRSTNTCLNGNGDDNGNGNGGGAGTTITGGGFDVSANPTTVGTASSGNISLAQAVGQASQAQLEFANATFSGNAAAAKKARSNLNKAANKLRTIVESNPKIAGNNNSKGATTKAGRSGGVLPDFDFGGGGSGGLVSLSNSPSSVDLSSVGDQGAEEFKLNTGLPRMDLGGIKSVGRTPSSEEGSGSLQPAYIADKNDELSSDTEVAKSDGKSLFDIITNRYQETAYPVLLRRKASGF
jgi:hypothetical protein